MIKNVKFIAPNWCYKMVKSRFLIYRDPWLRKIIHYPFPFKTFFNYLFYNIILINWFYLYRFIKIIIYGDGGKFIATQFQKQLLKKNETETK
jgi:hypothetical protein